MKESEKKGMLGKIIAFLLGLLFVFLIVEIVSRIIYPLSTPGSFYQVEKDLGWISIPNKKFTYTGRLKEKVGEFKSVYKTNSLGFKDLERAFSKNPNTFRIVVLGDSFVEAQQVPIDKTFTYLLEKALNRKSSVKHEVINLGVSGFGIGQYYLTYKKYGARFKPDIVILSFCLCNDVRNVSETLENRGNFQPRVKWKQNIKPFFYIDDRGLLKKRDFDYKLLMKKIKEDRERKPDVKFYKIKIFLSKHFNSYNFVINKIKSIPQIKRLFVTMGLISKDIFEDMETYYENNVPVKYYVYSKEYSQEWIEAWEITKRLILLLKDEVENDGAKLLVMGFDTGPAVYPEYKENFFNKYPNAVKLSLDFDKPDKIIEKFLDENAIDYLQLTPLFRKIYSEDGKRVNFKYDLHWNSFGHQVVAEEIHKRIVKNNWLTK